MIPTLLPAFLIWESVGLKFASIKVLSYNTRLLQAVSNLLALRKGKERCYHAHLAGPQQSSGEKFPPRRSRTPGVLTARQNSRNLVRNVGETGQHQVFFLVLDGEGRSGDLGETTAGDRRGSLCPSSLDVHSSAVKWSG